MDPAFHGLLRRVRGAITAHGMPVPGTRVLAAVSGGPDSVLLARVLVALGYTVEIAHLDHQARGADSRADAAFVRELAEALGAPYHLDSLPVAREAVLAGRSFEQHARQVRYAFLERAALASGCGAIATGHHAGDQAETVILRLLRGAAPRGLAGIAPVRHGFAVPVMRPLLRCTRAEILSALEEQGWLWREDRSNADTSFARNRVRHDLLPALEADYNPALEAALGRLAEAHRLLNDYLAPAETQALARLAGGERIRRAAFAELHPALAHRCLVRLFERWRVEPGFDRIVEAAAFIMQASAGKRFDLGRGLFLFNTRTHAELVRATSAVTPDPGPVPLSVPGHARAQWRRFTATVWTGPPPENPAECCTPARQLLDADAIRGGLVIRCRRPGDRFTPLGMTGTRKLKDCLREAGIPAPHRARHPILSDDAGILWVTGCAVAARAALSPSTQRVVEITVARDPEEDRHAPK